MNALQAHLSTVKVYLVSYYALNRILVIQQSGNVYNGAAAMVFMEILKRECAWFQVNAIHVLETMRQNYARPHAQQVNGQTRMVTDVILAILYANNVEDPSL